MCHLNFTESFRSLYWQFCQVQVKIYKKIDGCWQIWGGACICRRLVRGCFLVLLLFIEVWQLLCNLIVHRSMAVIQLFIEVCQLPYSLIMKAWQLPCNLIIYVIMEIDIEIIYSHLAFYHVFLIWWKRCEWDAYTTGIVCVYCAYCFLNTALSASYRCSHFFFKEM